MIDDGGIKKILYIYSNKLLIIDDKGNLFTFFPFSRIYPYIYNERRILIDAARCWQVLADG